MVTALCGVFACGYAQSSDGPVKTVKTKSGSVTYIVIRAGEYDLDIFSKAIGEPTDFAGVAQRVSASKRQLVFAMNGAPCDKGMTPLGVLIKGDTKYHDFVPDEKHVFSGPGPGGVFVIDRQNGIHIVPAKGFKAADDLATYKLAIQAGTTLVSKGFLNPAITRAVSPEMVSGIGVTASGDIVLAIANDKISLHEFAVFFQQVNCRDALLLDQGAGCQWYVPGGAKKAAKMGEILTVTKK
jgi:uncharacterized protein YigE (DUF2233 family)